MGLKQHLGLGLGLVGRDRLWWSLRYHYPPISENNTCIFSWNNPVMSLYFMAKEF